MLGKCASAPRNVPVGCWWTSALAGEAYFALLTAWRLWRRLRPFPKRHLYTRFPPNCDVHERGRLRPLYVDSSRQLRAKSSHWRRQGERVKLT
jgi:hypothetical protein